MVRRCSSERNLSVAARNVELEEISATAIGYS